MKQRILLLGGSGMLGRALRDAFLTYEITAPKSSELDITDSDAVRDFVKKLKPDVILNAAAYTAVDSAESDEKNATAINTTAVEHLANTTKVVGALLVHFSTDYVFDGKNPAGYTETDTPSRPLNIYGATKLAGEIAIKNSGCRHAIIRTSWLFGLHGSNFVETMLRLGHEHAELKVVADQIGCPTFCDDLAIATRGLIESREEGIFHLVNENPTSWADFAREIFRQVNVSCTVVNIPSSDYPTPARRPACSILKNTRRPKLQSWQDALADYLSS